MSTLSNLELIRRVPLFAVLGAQLLGEQLLGASNQYVPAGANHGR
jgi:hypothetical protein